MSYTPKAPTRVADLLGQLKAVKYIRAWKHSAGPVLLNQAKFLGIRRHDNQWVLALEVSDPLWRQELSYQCPEILKRFNEALKHEGVPEAELPRRCSLGPLSALPFQAVNAQDGRNKKRIKG